MATKHRRGKGGKAGGGRGGRPRQAEHEDVPEGGPPRLDLLPVRPRERDWFDVAGKTATIIAQLAKAFDVVDHFLRHWS